MQINYSINLYDLAGELEYEDFEDVLDFVMEIDSHQELSFTKELIKRLTEVVKQWEGPNA